MGWGWDIVYSPSQLIAFVLVDFGGDGGHALQLAIGNHKQNLILVVLMLILMLMLILRLMLKCTNHARRLIQHLITSEETTSLQLNDLSFGHVGHCRLANQCGLSNQNKPKEITNKPLSMH